MAHIKLELNSDDLKRLVVNHVNNLLGDVEVKPAHVRIELKQVYNPGYKNEWQPAEFRAIVEVKT